MGTQRRPGLLASPIFAVSILLLIVNDHVLKAEWPGLVTGKLSDIAGVAMIAVLLTAVLGRVSVAVATTAVGFGLLKTVPTVAEWSAPVLGGVTRTDPYDLVALLVLVPLWWWLRRRPAVGVDDRGPGRTAVTRTVLSVALVSAAVFATTATSCDTKGVEAINVYNGVLLASASDGEYISNDGGATWQHWPKHVAIDWSSLKAQTRACVDTVCFSADEANSRLSQTEGASETPVLELDKSQQKELSDLGNPECLSLAFDTMAAVKLNGAEHIVVSMGPAGAIHRSPDGSWKWVRIGHWGVPDSTGGTYLGLPVSKPG